MKCPKCGENTVKFKRETIKASSNRGSVKVGKVRVSKGSGNVQHRTIGICEECGYTFQPSQTNAKKSSGSWKVVIAVLVAIMILGAIAGNASNKNKNKEFAEATITAPTTEATKATTSEQKATITAATIAPSATQKETDAPAVIIPTSTTAPEYKYIINTDSHKIHSVTCYKVDDILPENKQEVVGMSVKDFLEKNPDYSKCGICFK